MPSAEPPARRLLQAAILVLTVLGAPGPATARVTMTQEEALREAFPPPAAIERRTLYLDEAQAKRASDLAGVPVDSRVVPYYVGRVDGAIVGYAYFDTHRVRTLMETVMIRLTSGGSIVAIDIVAFDEPPDYEVSGRWLEQFRGLADPTAPLRTIHPMTGATLSARAVTTAARRILALHRLFVARGAGGSGP